MDAHLKQLDKKVADVAEHLDWEQWEMDSPTYKMPQCDILVDHDPGAREFHRTDGHGGRDGTSIRMHHIWNASASFHPGQPTEWPAITVRLPLPEGRYDLQRRIAEKFRLIIEEELNRD